MILYLFDIDGTLLHARKSGRAAFDALFAEHHGITNACDGMSFGGKTDPALIDEIFHARMGRAPSDAERTAFLDSYLPRLRALLAEGVDVYDGVVVALEYLAAQPDVVLGIATGNVKHGADAKLAAANLAHHFVLGGYGSDSHLRPELVRAGIERAAERGPVRDVVVVGDTVHDIAAARACNAIAVAVTTGSDPADKLRDADVVLGSLHELPAWHRARFT